jgi:hypothetical protein
MRRVPILALEVSAEIEQIVGELRRLHRWQS